MIDTTNTVAMNRILAFLFVCTLVIGFSITSCTPTPTEIDANGLVASPDTLHFTNIQIETQKVQFKLLCGCKFPLSLIAKGGDTAFFDVKAALSTPADVLGVSVISPHIIDFTNIISGTVPNKTYMAWYAFYAPDDAGAKFYDTVRVFMPAK